MDKKISVSVSLAITLIAMTVTFSITMIIAINYFDNTVNSVLRKQALFDKLTELDQYVRGNYYGEIDDQILSDRIAQGYINGIEDKYGVYYSEKEFTEMQEFDSGVRVGIGIEFVQDADGYFRIVRVYEDSPAAKAGITVNGRITKIGDVDARTLTSRRAVNSLLRDKQGTTLELTCLYGAADEQVFSIQRINYTAPTVEYIHSGDFAYIRIYSFGNNTYTDFEYLVNQALRDGVKGFVFDVRNNSGGPFQQAYDMVDLLCPRGTVARSEAKNGTTRVLATSDDEKHIDLPMTVIVDENTAAAAELFAASIRELSDGRIVGMKTMGKGALQTTPPHRLNDGSAVSVTVALLRTGNGDSFEGVGIAPDVEVAADSEDVGRLYTPDPKNDRQILRALDVVRSMVVSTGDGTDTPAILTESSSSSSRSASSTSAPDSAVSNEEG